MNLSLEQTRKIIAATNAVLTLAVVLSGLLVARDAVLLYGTGNLDKTQQGQDSGTDYVRGLAFRDYAPILNNNPFGINSGELTPISSTTMEKPNAVASPSRVLLQVYGIVAWDGGTGYAFIKNPKGKQSVVRTGEDIPGSGILEQVYPDHIVVSVGGKQYDVNIAQPSTPKNSPAISGRPNKRGFARKTGKGQYAVNRMAVEDSISNPQRLLTDARMLPHYNKDKVQEGFTLSEVKPKGIYHTLGLRNDDIVLGVNGLAFSSPESALQAFSALKGSNKISVDVIRGGNRKTLTYNLR